MKGQELLEVGQGPIDVEVDLVQLKKYREINKAAGTLPAEFSTRVTLVRGPQGILLRDTQSHTMVIVSPSEDLFQPISSPR